MCGSNPRKNKANNSSILLNEHHLANLFYNYYDIKLILVKKVAVKQSVARDICRMWQYLLSILIINEKMVSVSTNEHPLVNIFNKYSINIIISLV